MLRQTSQPKKVETACSKDIGIPNSDPQNSGTKSKPIEVKIPRNRNPAAAKSHRDSRHVEFVNLFFSIGWAVVMEYLLLKRTKPAFAGFKV
jgi:hypothetical protein